MTGIDIYPGNLSYGDAFSPVKGTVNAIHSFRGHSSLPNVSELEYLILVQNVDDPSIYTKLLHVKPRHLKKGDYIDVGDKIGEYIRSFFFARWTDPHLHAEVRPKEDAIRARGAFPLTLCQPIREDGQSRATSLKAKLVKCTPNALFFEVNKDAFSKKKIAGLKVDIETKKDGTLFKGVIDAGIPYFGHGGIFTKDVLKITPGDIVKFNGFSIGTIIETNRSNKYLRFQSKPFHIRWKNITFKGISCRLSLRNRYIKIISPSTKSFYHQINEDDVLEFIS
jgi:murein DD-endopeptidase MepM/ murein hydrolase activator NlpD